jgi:glycosyltransferase involved in cell wall biosynthesis
MNNEFLSICIPTRNRRHWLERALARLATEIETGDFGPDVVKIYISDNCSTDDTEAMVRHFQTRLPHLNYFCHASNIDGDPNIVFCCQLGTGEYRWVMGDDDAIRPGVLGHVLERLRAIRPALFIVSDGHYAYGFKTPAVFNCYREFASTCMQVNPHALLVHSLITANIFRSDCFNKEIAYAWISGHYRHMHGLVGTLSDTAGRVYVSNRNMIAVRDSSTDPVDGVAWPSDMYKFWGDYLDWVKIQFDLRDLDRNNISQYIRRALILEIRAHPIKSALKYSRHLIRGQSWRSLRKLLKPAFT